MDEFWLPLLAAVALFGIIQLLVIRFYMNNVHDSCGASKSAIEIPDSSPEGPNIQESSSPYFNLLALSHSAYADQPAGLKPETVVISEPNVSQNKPRATKKRTSSEKPKAPVVEALKRRCVLQAASQPVALQKPELIEQTIKSPKSDINPFSLLADFDEAAEDAIPFWSAIYASDSFACALLKRYPALENEPAFINLSRDQKMFAYLLYKNTKESTHVEFKTSVNSSNDWKFRMLKSACSMYNGLDPDLREPSLSDSSNLSSYILYGVKECDRKLSDKKHELASLTQYPGEEEIQDCFRNNTTPFVKTYFHLVRFESETLFESVGLTIPVGCYAMLEVPRGTSGPVIFKDCRTRSDFRTKVKGHQERLHLLYSRSDAQNVPENNWDSHFRELVNNQFEAKCDVSELFWAKEDMIEAGCSFKALILTTISATESSTEQEMLAKALGRGTWDVIIDFDRDSRKDGGAFAWIEEEMRRQGRLSTVKSWEDLPSLQPHEIEECQSGHRTIYVQIMGCSVTDKPEPTNTHKLKKLLLTNLLNGLFEKNHYPRPVICTKLCLSGKPFELETSRMSFVAIDSYIKEAFLAESNDARSFKLVQLYVQQHLKAFLCDQASEAGESRRRQEKWIIVPFSQLCHLFETVHPSFDAPKRIHMPGKSGQFSMSREQFATFKPYLRLNHIQSGQSKYLSKPDDKKELYINNVRRQFLAGNELTKEMLHIHDELKFQSCGVYVERRAVESYVEKASKSLSHCGNRSFTTWDSNVRQIIRLHHQSVSGATTIARIVLWRLRKEYPCVEVKSFDRMQEVSGGICFLYKCTELPVLVLFDSKEFPYSSAYTFVSELNRRVSAPRFVVICVELVQTTSCVDSSILTVKLSSEEASAFAKIYDESGGDFRKLSDKLEKETDRTPFLFGVWHFRQGYNKISVFIHYLLKESEYKKNALLHFSCLTKYFTHSSLNLSIAAQFFDLPPEQKDPLQVLERLGHQRHLLTIKRQRRGWGLAPISIVGEKVLEYLFKNSEPQDREAEQVRLFVENLCKMGEDGPDSVLPCLTYLVRRLISCQKKTKNTKLTDFFMTMHDNLSFEEIESIFLRLARSFPHTRPHTLVHFARYIAYNKKDYTRSLKFVRMALDIGEDSAYFSGTSCTDDVVLGLSAHLINCRVSSGQDISFDEVQSLACESIRLCKTIKNIGPAKSTGDFLYKAHPFVCEIEAQRLLLERFFRTECHSDSTRYFTELEKEHYCVVGDAHQKIIENVLILEKMHEEGEIDPESITEKEMAKLNRANEEFVNRYRSSGLKLDLLNLDPGIMDNAFAWTIVDLCIRSSAKCTANSSDCDMLESFDDTKVFARMMWDSVWRLRWVESEELDTLFDVLQKCNSKLPRTYFEACVLTILSRPTKEAIERGLKLSLEWHQKFSCDVLANFMHGAFYLASALSCKVAADPKRKESLEEAKRALGKCDQLTERDYPGQQSNQKTFPGRNVPRLVLGTWDNLKALIYLPRRRSYEEQQKYILKDTKYRIFTGYLCDTNRVVCEELNSWVLRVPGNSVNQEYFRQRRRVSFAIALAYSGPVPYMIPAPM